MKFKQIPRLRAGLTTLVLAPVLVAGAFHASGPPELTVAPVDLALPALAPADLGQWCADRQAAGTAGLSQRARDWLTDCVALFAVPAPTPTQPTPTPTTPRPTATSAPTTSAPTTSAPPTSSPPSSSTGTRCMAQPSRCGFPDATNTGVPAGTALSVVNGGLTITTPGTVVDGKDIRGCVRVSAANVTIRRSKIACTGTYAVLHQLTTGTLTIEDSEISCLGSSGTAVGYNNFTARRLNIHDCENGFDVDNNAVIADNWVHLVAPSHSDGVQLNAGSRITIQHNTITNTSGTSAIITHPDGNSDVLIQNNLLAGGAYTLYCPEVRGTNIRVLDNRFSRILYSTVGAFGPWEDCEKATTVSGNVYDDDLSPLTRF